MKKEQVLEIIKKAVGEETKIEDINIDLITEEWNNSVNGAIKAETERAIGVTRKELLSNLGYETEEDIKNALETTKSNKEKENERIQTLEKTIETIQNNLKAKDEELQTSTQKELLRGLKIKDDRLNDAYALIKNNVTDEVDFKTAAQSFIEKTPEWVNKTKPSVTVDNKDDNTVEVKKEDAETLEGAWL
jgi:hypothetical protein